MPHVSLNHPKLTLEGAEAILDAAKAQAARIGVPMNIAVVDDGGFLMAVGKAENICPLRIAAGWSGMRKLRIFLLVSSGCTVIHSYIWRFLTGTDSDPTRSARASAQAAWVRCMAQRYCSRNLSCRTPRDEQNGASAVVPPHVSDLPTERGLGERLSRI